MTYAKVLKMAGAFQPRLMEHEIAELYCAGEAMFSDLRKIGLKPVKKRSTTLVYDRFDIDASIDKAKEMGLWDRKKNDENQD